MDSSVRVILPAEVVQTSTSSHKHLRTADPIRCGVHVSALVTIRESERWPLVYYRAQQEQWVGPMHISCEQLPVGRIVAIGDGTYSRETSLVSIDADFDLHGRVQQVTLNFQLPGTRYFFGGAHEVITWPFWAMKAFAANNCGVNVAPLTIMSEFDAAEQCNVGFRNAQKRLCAVAKRNAEREIESDDLLAFLQHQQELLQVV